MYLYMLCFTNDNESILSHYENENENEKSVLLDCSELVCEWIKDEYGIWETLILKKKIDTEIEHE